MKPVIRFAEIGQNKTASNPQAPLRFVHLDRILNTGVPSKAKKERKKRTKVTLAVCVHSKYSKYGAILSCC